VKLSVVIPAQNEGECIDSTIRSLVSELRAQTVNFEILVVNDHSIDQTAQVLEILSRDISELRAINNVSPSGFGFAVCQGLKHFSGDAIAIYMADGSDSPKDLIRFYREMEIKNVDCVFGTRWSRQSKVIDYPWFKLILNRAANHFIKLLFGIGYNDITNSFKLYSRKVVRGLEPIISSQSNLSVELPLKAIVRGFSYTVLSNSWTNRKIGVSKLKIKEMGSRYLFIILYCFLEKWLSNGDYHRDAFEYCPKTIDQSS